MSNYYETCIQNIKTLIEKGAYEEAKTQLQAELALPYIPEPYQEQFEALWREIPLETVESQRYFEDASSIYRGLGSDQPEYQQKALQSLSHLNVRNFQTDILDWLVDATLHDVLKKSILFILQEQGIEGPVNVVLKQQFLTLDLSQLHDPFKSRTFLNAQQAIREALESTNPSLMLLAEATLEERVFNEFPFLPETYDVLEIIASVEQAMQE